MALFVARNLEKCRTFEANRILYGFMKLSTSYSGVRIHADV